ncbi:F-actin-monooxygenase MICAL3 isoform X6 [Diachasmimorpha longicaudata]|uniref:F-actin-monooxygenase MICAL3 isoform X6 n=1 Tax=Diachasmimorpha longicaudata TaxID=58733 RepID=UPI0030B8980B
MDHGHQGGRKQLAVSPEVAMANEVFDQFCNATTLKSILGHFRHLCDLLNMRSNTFPQFYPKFKSKLRSWKAQALWKKFDQRANHKCYNRGKACPNTRVLIIGGGPCGLRAAIEAQLLGAKVVVIEKRDRMSRNNVLHLWPFVIQDLRGLGAKKFFGKFCAGSIDHISIRQLQCILLKVALILGVEFHEGVSFESLVPPPEAQEEGKIGWRTKTTPSDHPVSQYEFDVLIGADGKRNTLEGFKRKEFRGKLAIAITANFINKRTEAEARVEEISGVAFIFNQKFFKELYQDTGIDLENIVYYKDDTHYFVMTAKKHSLIDKGVILQDHADTAKLLAKENVDRDALMLYAREAADFSTQYQMVDMEFAVNHYGQPDVAMFDFTSMYAAENASRVIERHGHRLLMTLVGDSLLEPFWPTGSGCARGFLSSLDACWAIKSWSAQHSPLEVLAERESIYRLLGQTTPENLNRDYAAYTLDPHTRYPNLNPRSVSTVQVRGLLETDDPESLKQPPVQPSVELPKKRRRRDTQIHPDTLLHWLQKQVVLYDAVQITDMTSSFKDGLAICAIIHRYRPDLIDFYSLKSEEVEKNNQLAFDVLEKELGIAPDREPKMALQYKGNMDEDFSGRIKNMEDKLRGATPTDKKPRDLLRAIGKIEKTDWNVKEIEKKIEENKMSRGARQDRERVPKWSREQFLARQIKMEKKGKDPNEPESKYTEIDNTLKSMDRKIKDGNVLGHNKVSAMAEQFANKNQDNEPKVQRSNSKAAIVLPTQGGSETCHFCDKRVYLMERLTTEGKFFHRGCFRCEYCSTSLRIGNHTFDREKNGGRFYCTQHFGLPGTMKTRLDKKKVPLLNKENIPDSSGKIKTTPEKSQTLKPPLDGVAGLDLLDRGQTPERIEFENLAEMSDAEEAHSQMDEDEWTDRNFGASAAEMGSSDDISDMSDSDDDNEIYEEAIDQPLTTEGTIELAKNWTLRYSTNPHGSGANSDTGSNEYEDSSDDYTSEDEESGTATEDEDEARARELRKQEVWVKVPPRESDDTETGSETEVASDESSSEECQENSATEISTDSEFEHDGTTPTQHEIPEITINDCFVRKTRGQYVEPKKVQVKSRMISPVNGNVKNEEPNSPINKTNMENLSKTVIRPTTLSPMPLINPRKGDYLLNRTHSTEGIASKLSLELKKKYLLGGSVLGGSVMKSGSTSNVDTKLRNFTDSISQHQKLLNPAPVPSPTMQAFLQGTNKLHSTSNIPLSPISTKPKQLISSVEKPKDPELPPTPLPDLLKETNIMKSKTDPNILRTRILSYSKNPEGKIDEAKIEDEKDKILEKILDDLQSPEVNEENGDCRPRSPLHETSIVVPQVDWSKTAKDKNDDSTDDSEMDSDSLSSSETDVNEEDKKELIRGKLSPPRLQIHSTDGDLLLDEEIERYREPEDAMNFEPDSIECILNVREEEKSEHSDSIKSDPWARPREDDNKTPTVEIEAINNNLKRLDLTETNQQVSNCSSPSSVASSISKHDDSFENDLTTAALTETEFSEWARDGDGLVSADLKDTEFDMSLASKKPKYKFNYEGTARIAKEEDLTDIEQWSENYSKKIERAFNFPCNDTSKLLANGEDIDYMDTDNESLLDSLRDTANIPVTKNRGYVEFVNVSDIPRDELNQKLNDAPIARAEVEPESISDDEKYQYNKYDNVIEINPVTMDDIKDRLTSTKSVDNTPREPVIEAVNREMIQSMDEDSLLVIEQTEDTTTSELTTIKASPVCPLPPMQPEMKVEPSKSDTTDINHPDYLEYVKRLQSRIAEFSNVKDSIDVRKSKRKNSKNALPDRSAEMIAEEIKNQESLNTSYNSPATSRKLEELTRERSKQKNLIQDLLMDKIEAHKQKSAEKKAKRAARTASCNSGIQLFPAKCSTPPAVPGAHFPLATPIRTFAEAKKSLDAPASVETKQFSEIKTLPSIEVRNDPFKTPVAPPRLKHEEARRTAEKAKQEARARARLKSDEDLGLSPEDKIKLLRMKVPRRQLSMEDRPRTAEETTPEAKTRHYSFTFHKTGGKLQPSKSTDNMKAFAKKMTLDLVPASSAKSMDELAHAKRVEVKPDNDNVVMRRDKKKPKDPERRKSIIQAVSDFFKKKEASPSPTSHKDKGSVFRLTSKAKDKAKLYRSYSEGFDLDKLDRKSDTRPKSACEGMLIEHYMLEASPPVPPPPRNYSLSATHISDDSLSDEDSKTAALTSQMQRNTLVDGSCSSISRRVKNSKKLVRQKRLRMAQEIQRKLEETEVKQRDLESRGVIVEKALNGEGECSGREETDLLREFFDLMRERTELRRYEKELLVRAQEVQLEDRHERLEQELRERLADDDKNKTNDDVKKEGEILTEMLEIVAKRDSLIALLEDERQRWRRPSCPTIIAPYSTATQITNTFTPLSILTSPFFALLGILVAFTVFIHLVDHFVSSFK